MGCSLFFFVPTYSFIFSFFFPQKVALIIIHLLITTIKPGGIYGSNKAPPPLSVTGQPLDGAPAVVHVPHFFFHLIIMLVIMYCCVNHEAFSD